ncbi:MAG: hypothetical protein FJZ97_08830 [Chloroflexi bacterium]|nr:hypothetical protein [Chloroflexota bacterium]
MDFEFAGVYDVKPGDLVTATDGATVREHVVLPLTVDKISGRADTATGTSFAGANVYIHPWDPDTWWFEPVEADEFGDWSMDFADLYNLVPGLWGVAQVFDEDGDLTAIDWMVPLDIDVRPWSSGNLVACGAAWDLLPVAVLSESGFDATGVDHNSVRFGRTGAEAAVVRIFGRPLRYPRDVNGDGLLDMVYTFRFGDTGFSCTDIPRGQRYTRVEGILTAMMGDVYLEGKDNLTIVRLFIR